MLFRTATASVLALWIPQVAMAGEEHQRILTVGDLAPAIDVTHWVKGKPLKGFEPGHVYVVEFWATWCAPCRAVIPHMSDLQEQYED